jgi:hypothetical protein
MLYCNLTNEAVVRAVTYGLQGGEKKDGECKNAQDKRTLAVNITKYSTGRTGSAAGLRSQAYKNDITEYPGT